MTVHEFIKKYGTHTVPSIIRELGANRPGWTQYIKIADDLQATLENYAAQDIEEPTVDNRVI